MLRSMLIALGMAALAACAQTNAAGSQSEANTTVPAVVSDPHHQLINRLAGQWVLTGTIARQNTIHDVDAAWVLQGNYVRLTEVSRERDGAGKPTYEAIIFIGWSEAAHRYICFWLDNTEVATGDVTCSAADSQDTIALEFRDAQGTLSFTNAFVYHAENDSWEWRMDNIRNGAAAPFARVTLRRR